MALRLAFGTELDAIWVSSTKSRIGHTMGSVGALKAIATITSLGGGILHPTINLDNPDPDCVLRHVANKVVEVPIDAALSVNMGFGGHNGCMLFSKA